MEHHMTLRRLISLLQVLLLCCGCLLGQTGPEAKVRKGVDKIGLQGDITVYMPDGLEYYGSVSRIGTDDFSVAEVDQRREVTLRYSDVKNVRGGYGTGRAINGKRIHPRKRLWVMVAVVGGLLTLVFVAVASDKS
jgi:hypothetical protein